MSAPQHLFYTKTHEWVSIENGIATVGITDFAQQQLSDMNFVELPGIGKTLCAGDEAAVLESVKAAADVYAPVTGSIVEVNTVLEEHPELINHDALGKGWLFKIKTAGKAEMERMMDANAYEEFCPSE